MNKALKELQRLRDHHHDANWSSFDQMSKALQCLGYTLMKGATPHRATWESKYGPEFNIYLSLDHSGNRSPRIHRSYLGNARRVINSLLTEFPELQKEIEK